MTVKKRQMQEMDVMQRLSEMIALEPDDEHRERLTRIVEKLKAEGLTIVYKFVTGPETDPEFGPLLRRMAAAQHSSSSSLTETAEAIKQLDDLFGDISSTHS